MEVCLSVRLFLRADSDSDRDRDRGQSLQARAGDIGGNIFILVVGVSAHVE